MTLHPVPPVVITNPERLPAVHAGLHRDLGCACSGDPTYHEQHQEVATPRRARRRPRAALRSVA